MNLPLSQCYHLLLLKPHNQVLQVLYCEIIEQYIILLTENIQTHLLNKCYEKYKGIKLISGRCLSKKVMVYGKFIGKLLELTIIY